MTVGTSRLVGIGGLDWACPTAIHDRWKFPAWRNRETGKPIFAPPVHTRRSIFFRIAKHIDRRSKWAQDQLARACHNKTLAAMANKTARIAWAMLRNAKMLQGGLAQGRSPFRGLAHENARRDFDGVTARAAYSQPVRSDGQERSVILEGTETSGSHRGQKPDCFNQRPNRFTHPMR